MVLESGSQSPPPISRIWSSVWLCSQDVEEFGAGGLGEGVEVRLYSAFELIGPHGRRLRPRPDLVATSTSY